MLPTIMPEASKIIAICVYGFDSNCGTLRDIYKRKNNLRCPQDKAIVLRRDWLQYRFYQEAFTEAEKELSSVYMLSRGAYETYFTFDTKIPVDAFFWDGSIVSAGWAFDDLDSAGVEMGGGVWSYDEDATHQTNPYVRPVISIQIADQTGNNTLKVGDVIEFGSYEQDNDLENGKEAISWKVVWTTEDSAFIVSTKVLDCQCYDNEGRSEVNWKDCSLRAWLNNEFYEEAFSESEKAEIQNVETGEVMASKSEPTVIETYDNVFCLYYEEQKRYSVGEAEMTPYAEARGVFRASENLGKVYCTYWLRLNAGQSYNNIVSDGQNPGKKQVDSPGTGVRPAMWIKLP